MAAQIQIELHQTGRATAKTVIRGHEVVVDRPTAKGGDDRGPMGGEYLLAALGGCFMSNLLAAIRAREAPVRNAKVTVTATVEEKPPRFSAIAMEVSAETRDLALLEKLVVIAERGCIVSNTLSRGVELKVQASQLETA